MQPILESQLSDSDDEPPPKKVRTPKDPKTEKAQPKAANTTIGQKAEKDAVKSTAKAKSAGSAQGKKPAAKVKSNPQTKAKAKATTKAKPKSSAKKPKDLKVDETAGKKKKDHEEVRMMGCILSGLALNLMSYIIAVCLTALSGRLRLNKRGMR